MVDRLRKLAFIVRRSSGGRTSPRDKFLDEDVLVLQQARRTSPLAIAPTPWCCRASRPWLGKSGICRRG